MSTDKRAQFSIELAIDNDRNGFTGRSIIHKTKLDWHPVIMRPSVTGNEIGVSSVAWMERVERKKYQFPVMWKRLGMRVMEDEEENDPSWWLNIETGEVSPNPPPVEPAVRGGMLCDEPGLGKTITVAGLILRNVNRVARPPPPPPPPSPSQAEINFSYWCKEDKVKRLLGIIRRIQNLDGVEPFNCLISKQSLERWGMAMYEEIVGPPPWPDLVSISHSVTMGRCQTLRIFEGNVRRVFINAISYHGGTTKSDDVGNDACCGGVVQGCPEYHYPGAVLYIAKFAEEFLEHFDSEMSELRALLLYRKRNQTGLQDNTKSSRLTIASAATLIVVPPPLVHHWHEQFESHIEDGYRGLMLFDYPQPKSQPLPPPSVLGKYDVVITTYARLTNERKAEHRWIMTGTPSPAVFSLSNYLLFLRVKVGSTASCMASICRSFRAGAPEGAERLRCILTDLMTSHTKEDVKIPPPIRTVQKLDMSMQESIAYDAIASYVRANILLTSILQGRTSAWQDSLLNSANIKYALQALYNLRCTCCGGGTMLPTLKRHHELETLRYLRYLYGAQEIDLARIAGFMRRVTSGELSSCQSCGGAFQILLITPCAHTVCTECVDQSCSSTCAVCHKRVDIDDFQRLQPGFVLQWKWNEPHKMHHLGGPTQSPLPPSRGSRGRPNNAETSEAGWNDEDDHIRIHRMVEQQEQIIPSSSEAETSRLRTWEEELARKEAARELSMHSKASFVIQLIKFLGGYPSLNWEKKGQAHVAEFWGRMKNVELKKFCCDPECKVLLLGKDGSHGLDLSFSTHLFLLEGVWNSSLESQIVSRAHRMGAKESVEVIQLVMKNTIEEQMQSLAESAQEPPSLSRTATTTTTTCVRDSSHEEKPNEKQEEKNRALSEAESLEGIKIRRIHFLLSNARPSQKRSSTNNDRSCLAADDDPQVAVAASTGPEATATHDMENHSAGGVMVQQQLTAASLSKKKKRRVAFSEEC